MTSTHEFFSFFWTFDLRDLFVSYVYICMYINYILKSCERKIVFIITEAWLKNQWIANDVSKQIINYLRKNVCDRKVLPPKFIKKHTS